MVLLRPPPRLNGRSLLTLSSQLRPSLRHDRSPNLIVAIPARNQSFTSAAIYDAACTSGWTLLQAAHGVGLSWGLAIPVAAIIVRLAIIYPLLYAPARRAQLRGADARAHVQAFESITKSLSRKKMMQEGPEASKKYAQTQLRSYNEAIKKRWKFGFLRQMQPFLALPIFLSFAETIRRMTGSHKGIMGLVLSAPEDAAAPLASEAATSKAVETTVAENVSAALNVPDGASWSWIEPSMTTEGMLWFTDLTAADPTLTLPLIVSSATFFAVWRGSKVPDGEEEAKSARILRRSLLSASVIMFPLILKVPAGMLLYWATSTTCAGLTHIWNDYYYPRRTRIKPVKRLMPFKRSQRVGS
ncbi:60Kd inner membrane protein-domain-containing protein [Phyllosticta capitalensis]|uniref:60Kd inner membrane protein-domain-containing protein n=1 Tax=Phyllosticta capitalensis TaxID=121624 RepID=A0ABR1Z0B7_9PEZI